MIFVTNHNDFVHTDRYDGTDYVFAPGKAVLLSEEAAKLLFGFGTPDKGAALVRLGWSMRINPDSGKPEEARDGVEKLRKFVFTEAQTVAADTLDDVPPPPPPETDDEPF